jgi:hypothetical protein
MTLPRPRRRSPPRQGPDRWSDMLRGAAVAVVVVGMVVSALVAKGWRSTIVRQHDERLDRGRRLADGDDRGHDGQLRERPPGRSLWVSSDSVSRALYAAKDAGRDRIHADGPATVEAAAP